MTQAEEDLLVLNAQNGSHKAFSILFRLYHKPLIGFAIKLSNKNELVYDAVQEAWIKAARNIHQLKDPRAFKSWIYRLVRWKLLDSLKKQARESKIQEVLDEESMTNTLEISSAKDEELSAAINRLPNTEKQIIHLFYLDEMKITEISIILEIPVGTVKSRLNRARQLLKEKYELMEN